MITGDISSHESTRCAVVTGANKGIGYEICRQLAGEGMSVVLTSRDEKRGIEAVERLKVSSAMTVDHLLFHQLDVVDPASISFLVDFIKTKFGKLDVLVNNAGVIGAKVEGDVTILRELIEREDSQAFTEKQLENVQTKSNGTIIETYELAEECLQANYFGAKRMIEAFLPLLQLSNSPRIVNVSSTNGKLKLLSNEWAIRLLSDGERLSNERVDEMVKEFLTNFKEGSLQTKFWPRNLAAYKVSKAALNAYTRIVAKKYPNFVVNCVCPGYVKTDICYNTGLLTPREGAEHVVKLALLPNDAPSGAFYLRNNITSF